MLREAWGARAAPPQIASEGPKPLKPLPAKGGSSRGLKKYFRKASEGMSEAPPRRAARIAGPTRHRALRPTAAFSAPSFRRGGLGARLRGRMEVGLGYGRRLVVAVAARGWGACRGWAGGGQEDGGHS